MDNWRIIRLKEMYSKDPTDQFVIYALAQEYLKSEEYKESISYFDLLKSINPDYVGLYYHLAAAHAALEDIEKAMAVYEEGIHIATQLKDLHALSELKNAKLNLEMGL